jgi:hypothetical protein
MYRFRSYSFSLYTSLVNWIASLCSPALNRRHEPVAVAGLGGKARLADRRPVEQDRELRIFTERGGTGRGDHDLVVAVGRNADEAFGGAVSGEAQGNRIRRRRGSGGGRRRPSRRV